MKEEIEYLNKLIINKLEFIAQWEPIFEVDQNRDIGDLIQRLEKDIQLLNNIKAKIEKLNL